MIAETIVTTQSALGEVNIAPMGVYDMGHEQLIRPFKPTTTLDNLLETGYAIINYTDDVRLIAGCVTGRKKWPLSNAETIPVQRLTNTLAHAELKVIRVDDSEKRPRFYCKVVHEVNHAPFRGFNRAQYAVLEASILVSRLHLLRSEKIASEIDYLRIGIEKCAGPAEREAWGWLMERIERHKQGQ